MNDLRKKWFTLPLCLALVFILAACGEDEDENQNQNQEEDSFTVAGLDVIDRDEDDVTAYIHGDHWHGSLPILEEDGNRMSLGARFLDEDDEEIDIDYDHYTFDARFAPGENEDLVEIESHGDHIHIRPASGTGDTAVIFELRHHDDVVYESPLLTVIVTDGDADTHVVNVEILNRDDDQSVAADTDGDHWHGSLPQLEADGNRSSLGARFLNASDEAVAIDYSDHSFDARFADGADDTLIEIESHGDHIHLRPQSDTGETMIIFELKHGEEVLYETPEIEVFVVEGEPNFGPPPNVTDMDILDRSTDPHTKVADTDGDHWHGALPTLHEDGDNMSIGPVWYEDGVDLELERPDYEGRGPGPYDFRARFADGASDDLVEFGFHDDHIHITPISGAGDGETMVIFELHYVGEGIIYESPAIEVVVMPGS